MSQALLPFAALHLSQNIRTLQSGMYHRPRTIESDKLPARKIAIAGKRLAPGWMCNACCRDPGCGAEPDLCKQGSTGVAWLASFAAPQPTGVAHSPESEFFLSDSTIDTETLRAYLETDYRVEGQPAFTLRVGVSSPELAATHRAHHVLSSAFISACNPFSQRLDAASNAIRHAALERQLGQSGLAFLPGVGQHSANQWPGEASFLIFGIALDAATTLGNQWEQNAIIWSGADAKPQLILLR
ncbi:MAG: DUF3293 domain-containing protein [Magnetococcus sp. YQC-3]